MADTLSHSLRGIIGGTAVVFVGNAIGMGSSFGTKVIAARYLEPANYGWIVLGVTLLTITTHLVLLGLHHGLAQRLPGSDDAEGLFAGAVSLSVPLAVLFAAATILVSPSLSRVFGGTEFAHLLAVFALALPFMVYLELVVGGFRGLERAGYRVVAKDILFKGLLVLAVAVGAVGNVPPVGIAGAWLGSLVVAAAGATYLLFRKTPLLSAKAGAGLPNLEATYSLALFSLPLMVSGASWLLMQHLDNALLGYFLSSADVGIYDAAYSLATSISLVVSAFSFLFLPIFSRLNQRGERQQMKQFYEIVTKWMTFLVLPPFLLLVLYPRTIITWVYGAEYASGSPALVLVILGLFVTTVAGHANEGIVALGDSRLVLLGNVSALVLNVVANLVLIPPLGIVGAAVATLLSYVVVNLFFSYHLFERTGIHSLSPSLVRPALVAGTGFLVATLALGLVIDGAHERLLLSVILVLPYAGLLVRFGGVDREEIDMLVVIDEHTDVDIGRVISALERFS